MAAPAPWSVKGIDPRAREVAKELARREGVTLGEWLNRMIAEQEGGAPSEAEPEPGRYARAEPHEPIPLEPSVRGLLGRVERSEREQIAVAARFEGLADELRNDQMRIAERLRRIEQSGEGYGSTEALRALEQTVSRLAGHVYENESTTHDTLRDLGACFVKLDGRLRRVEDGHGAGAAAELDRVRSEMMSIAEQLERKIDRADSVHAQALERLGEEVARISERLAERIANSERRSSMAIDEVSEQVSRVAERIHQRQERAAEDVADRIRQAEERTARMLEETRAQIEASFANARARFAPAQMPLPSDDIIREPFADGGSPLDEPPSFDDRAGLTTREIIEQARAETAFAIKPKTASKKEGFSFFPSRKKKGSSSTTLQTALFVTGTAAALGAGVASYMLGVADPAPSTVSVPDAQPAASDEPRLAVALDPQPADAAAPKVKPQQEKAATLYAEAVKQLNKRNWSGVDKLKMAANMGYPPAQFHLARLYEAGGAGLVKDEIEARRWTQAAALGGEAKAMHNLALYYYEGVGIGKDPAKAAEWFRRAAEKGLTDSQYNLGRLYEDGVGVPKDPAQAWHWYSLAAGSGDADAKAAAERMAPLANAPAQTAAQTR